jgi:hypothetical protein
VVHVAADRAGVGLHDDERETATPKDGRVRLAHPLVRFVELRVVDVKRVGVLHQKLACAHEPEAGTDLVAELHADLVEVLGEVPVGADVVPNEISDRLFVRRSQRVVSIVAVPLAEELLSVLLPPTCFLP